MRLQHKNISNECTSNKHAANECTNNKLAAIVITIASPHTGYEFAGAHTWYNFLVLVPNVSAKIPFIFSK
jgi:hypothetical protein